MAKIKLDRIARVLTAHEIDGIQYQADDLVEFDENHMESDSLDFHPDAVAYAKNQGVKVQIHPSEKPKKASAKDQTEAPAFDPNTRAE